MNKGRGVCGGAVVGAHWVLTAAHCVNKGSESSYTVLTGEHDRKVPEGSEEMYKVSKVFLHPQYRKNKDDMALIRTERPIAFNKYVSPVCVGDGHVEIGTRCYVTGWGSKKAGGGMSRVLQQAMLPVVERKICANRNAKSLGIKLGAGMMCGGDGGRTPKNGCHGDSGSPFVCPGVSGSWTVQGVVLYGAGDCDSGKAYTVFSRVGFYRSWIDSVMQHN